MHYHRREGWEIPASSATPEALFLDRRSVLAGLGASGALAAWAGRARAEDADPSAALYPAKRDEAYTLDREVTPEKFNLSYNNFYEFSTNKRLDASGLKTRPWTVKLDGMVEKEQTVDIDALIKTIGLEERLYRHRCVEAWSMAIPWTGFPLRKFVDFARPLSSAKYVQFETFLDKKMAPGQRSFMSWPYIEGLTMAEAENDLAFIATGAYGKPLAKVQGAPIRLACPWKYMDWVDQVDCQGVFRRQEAADLLADPGAGRIRLLGQRQSGGPPPALEPGARELSRTTPWHPPDLPVQRRRRTGRLLSGGVFTG